MAKMLIKPLNDKVIIKPIETAEATKSGIIIPGSAQEKSQIADVIEVGPGGVIDGEKVDMVVVKGDQVICSKYAGTEVKIDDEVYLIVRQSDILGIVYYQSAEEVV